jgi:hypothetical protein
VAIKRHLSFGPQPGAGAETREVLMCVVHTVAKRTAEHEAHFKAVAGRPAAGPNSGCRRAAVRRPLNG